MELNRITFDPNVMGGKPCIRGMRVTVGTIVGLIASGRSFDEVLSFYPYLESEDITEALAYAAWRADEIEKYNSELDEALARVKSGNYYTHEEVVLEVNKW